MTTPGERERTRSEQLAQQIVADATGRGLTPGDSLPAEAKMMELYGVGRATLREALRQLEAYGVITVRPGPGGGPRLLEVGAGDLAHAMKLQLHLRDASYTEVADARVAVESFLARLAAERQDSKGMRALRNVVEEIDDLDTTDVLAFTKVLNDFYATLRSMSGNQVLELLGSVLAALVSGRTDELVRLRPDERTMILDRCREIAAAVMDGRSTEAEGMTRRSMRYWVRSLQSNHPAVMTETVRWS